jgi:hypothetical protein
VAAYIHIESISSADIAQVLQNTGHHVKISGRQVCVDSAYDVTKILEMTFPGQPIYIDEEN